MCQTGTATRCGRPVVRSPAIPDVLQRDPSHGNPTRLDDCFTLHKARERVYKVGVSGSPESR
jgi:hypothetical protein